MTSNFAKNHHRLSPQTLDIYNRFGAHPRDTAARRYFYHTYLQDVVPAGITVLHIHDGPHNILREELQLVMTTQPSGSEKIFMSGLVGTELNHHYPAKVAGENALNQSVGGHFVPDDERKWRFFTGFAKIRFFEGRGNEKWGCKGEVDPIKDAGCVAEYLQREYDKLGHH